MTQPTLFDIKPERIHEALRRAHRIALNPSVLPEDAPRLSEQAQRILTLFVSRHERGLTVSTADMSEIACQYNARLYEVRRHLVRFGYCIDLVKRTPGTGINHYAVVTIDKSKFYKHHQHKLRT